jgi:hypothetical protein
MTPHEMLRLMTGIAPEIVESAQTGAAYEIRAQVALCNLLRNNGYAVAREVRYPGLGDGVRADLAFTIGGKAYIVEMKVESATNSGAFPGGTASQAISADSAKLSRFDFNTFLADTDLAQGGKFVLVIAYSAYAKNGIWGLCHNVIDTDPILFGLKVVP